ncbi:type IV toxin-antitoxin system AbiEi family antitoxin domain-containing protein [Streptomyces diastaticus]|uniref:type IV toxin-antitoxin system AbiEi family antitoxin domain-containing protein n=2 Tax=Streptomyces diastaticus TaxID=1956 RepID=UPI00366249C7
MNRGEQLAVLSGAATEQWGLVTAAQAKRLGLNAVQLLRLTEAGLTENVSRGVYLVTAAGMPTGLEAKAAWLRLQPKEFAWDRPAGHPDSGVLSHATACQLHELGDIPAPEVDITVPRRRTTTEPFVRLRTAALDKQEITIVDGLPTTTVDRTITDLLRAKADGGHVGRVIADAERRGMISLDDLAEAVSPYNRRYGLSAAADGRDLIEHLVSQAGQSLLRHDMDRASQQGFNEAVNRMQAHVAKNISALQEHVLPRTGLHAGLDEALAQVVSHTNLAKTMDEVLSQAALNHTSLAKRMQEIIRTPPVMDELLQRMSQTPPALTEIVSGPAASAHLFQSMFHSAAALQQYSSLPPATRSALERAAAAGASRRGPGAAAHPGADQELAAGPDEPHQPDEDETRKQPEQ